MLKCPCAEKVFCLKVKVAVNLVKSFPDISEHVTVNALGATESFNIKSILFTWHHKHSSGRFLLQEAVMTVVNWNGSSTAFIRSRETKEDAETKTKEKKKKKREVIRRSEV